MKKIIISLIIIGGGVFAFFFFSNNEQPTVSEPVILKPDPQYENIGSSVESRKIEAYTFGTGDKHLLFVGGIHGGYEWNSVLLAYDFIDYLKLYPEIIPANLKVTIIPSVNPDGIYEVTGKEGRFSASDISKEVDATLCRFNANAVDLNRNFDCKWQPESTWRNSPVSAGTSAFSEPEAKALKDFVLKTNPASVIFWHSQADAVYASECEEGILPETLAIMETYAQASGYKAISSFDSYPVTGDAEGWLASINIPAITVELKNHEDTDWEENLAGIKALFNYYQK